MVAFIKRDYAVFSFQGVIFYSIFKAIANNIFQLKINYQLIEHSNFKLALLLPKNTSGQLYLKQHLCLSLQVGSVTQFTEGLLDVTKSTWPV